MSLTAIYTLPTGFDLKKTLELSRNNSIFLEFTDMLVRTRQKLTLRKRIISGHNLFCDINPNVGLSGKNNSKE